MAHLDVVGAVSAALGAVGEVYPWPPARHPGPFYTVTREGGRWLNVLQDRAGVGIECWGDCEDGARSMAYTAADVMASLPFSEGFELVSMESMRSDPDPDTGRSRWYLSYTITCHQPIGATDG